MKQIVRRCDLGPRGGGYTREHPPPPRPPSVRYNARTGRLCFSKMASEVFGGRNWALVEIDTDEKTLTFSGYDRPPRNLDEDALFRITRIPLTKDGTSTCASIAVKRLLRDTGFRQLADVSFPVLHIDSDRHSIEVRIPADKTAENHADNVREEYQPVNQ